jgi:hypothetical protein
VPKSLGGEETGGEEREQVGSRMKGWEKKEQLGSRENR